MRLLFALGDAEYLSTDQKGWRFVARLRQQLGCEIVGATNEQWVADEAKAQGLDCLVYPFNSPGVTIAQRLNAIDTMINKTKDMMIPGSALPIWKILALDDFAGSLLLHGAQPSAFPPCDGVVLPIMGVDNNTKGGCGLYVWLLSEARKLKLPTISLEVSPLGNKQTMSYLPTTAYGVKSAFARQCLIQYGVPAAQIALVNPTDVYLLSPDKREYEEAFLAHEAQARELLHIDRRQFVVVIPHHVAFLWEIKHLLRAIIQALQGQTYSVVMKADPNLVRRQYTEVDIAAKVYEEEIKQIPHCVIDTQIGHALLFQLADMVLSPLPSVRLDWVTRVGTPLIICQAAGIAGWETLTTCWEPDPTKIPAVIRSFAEAGLFRKRAATVVESVMVWEQQRRATE